MGVTLWLILALVAGGIEAATVTLVSVWFAVGAVLAAIAAAFGASPAVQWFVFLIASLILLILTTPLCNKFRLQKKTPTNADRIIGQAGIVTEDIDSIEGSGEIKVGGLRWSARSAGGEKIKAGATVTIEEIVGVHVIVKEIEIQ